MADIPVLLGPGPVALEGLPPGLAQTDASSSAAGFLAPLTAPIYDDPLDNFFHAFLAALSTIPGPLVRPRWQPEPPNLPAFTTDWMAWGIVDVEADNFAFQGMPADNQFAVERDEVLTMLMSFYGPRAGQLASQVSMSMQLGQNRAYLRTQNLTLIEVMNQARVPALLKEKWVPRVDQRVRFRRRASWAYQVHQLEDFKAGLDNELYITDLGVPPTPT